MVAVTVRVKVAPGKASEAADWAGRVVACGKKVNLASAQTSIYRPLTGDTSEIVFVSQYSSVSEFGELVAKRRANSEWMAIVKEGMESSWYLGTTRRIYDIVAE
jgi:hypothetical protein